MKNSETDGTAIYLTLKLRAVDRSDEGIMTFTATYSVSLIRVSRSA